MPLFAGRQGVSGPAVLPPIFPSPAGTWGAALPSHALSRAPQSSNPSSRQPWCSPTPRLQERLCKVFCLCRETQSARGDAALLRQDTHTPSFRLCPFRPAASAARLAASTKIAAVGRAGNAAGTWPQLRGLCAGGFPQASAQQEPHPGCTRDELCCPPHGSEPATGARGAQDAAGKCFNLNHPLSFWGWFFF